MTHKLHRAAAIAAIGLALGGCVVYEPVPVNAPTMQERFDRSWSAAEGAFVDQGVTITTRDRAAGVIQGNRGGMTVTANIQTLADGRVQAKFNVIGTESGLAYRLSDSYDRRMGR